MIYTDMLVDLDYGMMYGDIYREKTNSSTINVDSMVEVWEHTCSNYI